MAGLLDNRRPDGSSCDEGLCLLDSRPGLSAYVERGIARPAFQAALAAQLADLRPDPVAA